MILIYGLGLIILGILAVPSLLLSKKTNAKELLDKIIPYQEWIGIIFCIAGLWSLLQAIQYTELFEQVAILWIMWVLVSVVEAILGFILGYSLIAKHVLPKDPEFVEKSERFEANLASLRKPIGTAAFILGIAYAIILGGTIFILALVFI